MDHVTYRISHIFSTYRFHQVCKLFCFIFNNVRGSMIISGKYQVCFESGMYKELAGMFTLGVKEC